MTTLSTHTLQVPGAALAYDVRGPLPTTGRPPLLMVGQPMDASGFATLADSTCKRGGALTRSSSAVWS